MFIWDNCIIDIQIPMCNLVEYSDNYWHTSGSLWQLKRDEVPAINDDLTINNSPSFKYKAALEGKTADVNNGNSFVKNTKIFVPLLKYLSNFWRSLIFGDLIVTLSTKDNVNLTEQLSGFTRSVYRNSYQTIHAKVTNKGTNIYELLSASFKVVKRFLLAYVFAQNAANDEVGIKNNRKYFLPRAEIENCNVLVNGRNF